MHGIVFFGFSEVSYENQKYCLTYSFRNFRIMIMEPAASIIAKLGGVDAIVAATGLAYTAPYR